jgi:hypothetical protein
VVGGWGSMASTLSSRSMPSSRLAVVSQITSGVPQRVNSPPILLGNLSTVYGTTLATRFSSRVSECSTTGRDLTAGWIGEMS